MNSMYLKPNEICDEVIEVGIKKANYSTTQVMLLGVLAGAYIALGGFCASMASHSISNVGVAKFVAGAVFPVGLMLVIICGADLFTGNCLMTLPLIEKRISLKAMLRNWGFVYFSNMIGAALTAFLLFQSGVLSTNGGKLGGYVLKVAAHKAELNFSTALSSGILCNIIVCLAVWGAYSAKDIVSKVAIIWFPIMAFVVAGFEHSVANMYYFSIALFAKTQGYLIPLSGVAPEHIENINFSHILGNLIPVTLGNIIGGAFVALSYWAIYKYSASKKAQQDITNLNA